MALDPESKARVKSFHQWVTFGGGVLFVLGAAAAGYVAFARPGIPSWLNAFAKYFHELTR